MAGAGKKGTSRGPHRWAPGESGNPEGRKPDAELAEVRKLTKDLFEPHVPAAVAALVRICMEGKSEAAVVAAAEKIIERARGKAPVTDDGSTGTQSFSLTLGAPGQATLTVAGEPNGES